MAHPWPKQDCCRMLGLCLRVLEPGSRVIYDSMDAWMDRGVLAYVYSKIESSVALVWFTSCGSRNYCKKRIPTFYSWSRAKLSSH